MGFDYWKMEPIISNSGNGVSLLTNGNIEQFIHKWGMKEINLYKKKFIKPTIKLDPNFLNKSTIDLFRSNEKIIIRGVAKRLTACIDQDGAGLLVAVHSAVPNDKENIYYLLGLINSNLLNWYHLHTYYSVRIPQGSLKYPIDCISTLPIPEPNFNKDSFKEITDIVKNIYKKSGDMKGLREQLDKLVYGLYDLSPEEIAIVEGVKQQKI